MHTQTTKTTTYGGKREIVRGCCRKIVRDTSMNAGGSPMNAGGARHGWRRQKQGVKPKQQRHKCQQTPTLLKLPVMANSTSALHSVGPAKLVTSGRGMCMCLPVLNWRTLTHQSGHLNSSTETWNSFAGLMIWDATREFCLSSCLFFGEDQEYRLNLFVSAGTSWINHS